MLTYKTWLIALLGLASLAASSAAQPLLLKDLSATRAWQGYGPPGFTGTGLPGSSNPIPMDLGRSSAIVDLDGDGFGDLVVGAPLVPTNPASQVLDDAGRVYVYFGGPGLGLPGTAGTFSFAAFPNGAAIEFVGDPGDRIGSSIAAAGDVNGDGLQDAIIGAPNHTMGAREAAGGAYLLLGRTNFKSLPKKIVLSSFAATPGNKAMFIQGARSFGLSGSSVSGNVDVNGDALRDLVLGAPLDSTNGRSQNGTATVLYGQPGFATMTLLDLDTQGAGQVTVVHGATDFQFVGFSVSGIGKFDPVLPMTNNALSPVLGDDVAIGAPGTTVGTKFFAGAVYALRGTNGGVPAASYTTSDFGTGPFKAGVVYTGKDAGDQAGFFVNRVGNLIFDADGYEDFAITSPFSDGVGKPNSGSIYVVGGSVIGIHPQGFDLGLLGQNPPTQVGIHIQGAVTNGGQQGVYVANAGDWNGDTVPDLLVGFPNVTLSAGTGIFVGAGRARVLNGLATLSTLGTVNLGSVGEPFTLISFSGEATGDYAGHGLAVGDLNGDGSLDVHIGAPGASSPANPLDFSGVANLETGRSHVVYGPLLRIDSMTPTATHFGGPKVTLTATNLPAGATLKVEGVPAVIDSLVPGTPGTLQFTPPKLVPPGVPADIALTTTNGNVNYKDFLTYNPLSISSGPNPPTGFEFNPASFTGNGFSTIADTTVTIGGFPAAVTAIDGLAGTMSITLPDGPPGNVPLDVVITNGNGSVTLTGAMTYLPLVVKSIVPNSGKQTSGIFVPGAVPFAGEPVQQVAVTVQASGALPPDLVIAFGTDALGYRPAVIQSIVGDVVTVDVPYFLLGPQNVVVNIRAGSISSTDVGILESAFTYQASDFTELSSYQKPGLDPLKPPVALMSGQFTNGGQVLLLIGNLAGAQSLGAVMFLGVALANPPLPLHGGLFGISLTNQVFSFSLPGGVPAIAISTAMPNNMPASANGLPLYIQVLTKEKLGAVTEFGLSNVLVMTIRI